MSSTIINPEVTDCVNNMILNVIGNQNNELTNELERLNKEVINKISSDTIKTKLNNLNKASVCDMCGGKRISTNSRCIITYKDELLSI